MEGEPKEPSPEIDPTDNAVTGWLKDRPRVWKNIQDAKETAKLSGEALIWGILIGTVKLVFQGPGRVLDALMGAIPSKYGVGKGYKDGINLFDRLFGEKKSKK